MSSPSDDAPDSLGPAIPPPGAPPNGAAAVRYRLGDEIGHGGMGLVLRGHDPLLGRDLAVKVLREEHLGSPELEQRFVAEAKIGGRLQHPGVAPVYDLGRLPDLRPYFAMKLVEGRTLADLLAERPTPAADLPRFLTVFEQVCHTVGYAHAQGVLHRDLKPENVMVGAFGEVQVMDWGLAKVLTTAAADGAPRDGAPAAPPAPTNAGWSQPGAVMGTLAYMAPEQAAGRVRDLDARCDVFGLGAVLCEMLTGKPPYVGRDVMEVYEAAASADLAGAYARLAACGADAALVDLVKACLAPERDDRPANGRAVAEAVAAYLAGVQERLRAADAARAAAQATATAERTRRKLTAWLAAAVLALAAVGVAGGLWYKQDFDAKQLAAADQARRDRERDEQAARVLDDAETWLRAADWAQAGVAIERAAARLANGGPRELHDRLDAARRDLRTAAALEKILLDKSLFAGLLTDRNAGNKGYAELFADYGIRVEKDRVKEEAGRIIASPIRWPLVAGLDDWAFTEPDQNLRVRLNILAMNADPARAGARVLLGFGVKRLLAKPDIFGVDLGAAKRGTPEEARAVVSKLLTDGSSLLLVTAAETSNDEAPEETVQFLEIAQQMRPNDFWLNVALAVHLAHQPGGEAKAVEYLRAALAVRPDSPTVQLYLAVGLTDLGRASEAAAAAERAVEIAPQSARAWYVLGCVRRDQHRPADAAAALEKAVNLDRDMGEAWLELGKARVNLAGGADALIANNKEAFAAFKEAARLQPLNGEARMLHALSLAAAGDEEAYIAELREAVRVQDNLVKAHMLLGEYLEAKGRNEDALVEFETAVCYQYDRAEAWGHIGQIRMGMEDYDEAADAYDNALRFDPNMPQAYKVYNQLGAMREMQGRHAESAAAFRRAVELRPDDANAFIGLGLALKALGRFAEATDAFRRGHELGKQIPGWPIPSGDFLRDAEMLARLDGELTQVLKGDDQSFDPMERLLIAQFAQHFRQRFALARRLFAGAFTDEPGLADDLRHGARHEAARAAAQAGCGRGDAADADPADRAAWRKQALGWLRDDLAAWKKRLGGGGPAARKEVREALSPWRTDDAFSGVRDKDALSRLPPAERGDWQALWADVDDLLQQAADQ